MARIPFRLEVLKRLTDLLGGVYGEDIDGNPFDMSGRVHRGRIEFGTETLIPALSILESPNPDIGIFAGSGEAMADRWTLLLQGWARDDVDNPSDPAYYLAAAVQERLALVVATRDDGSGRPVDPTSFHLGGIVTDIEIGPYVVRPVDARTSSRAFFYQPIRVGLARDVDQPYHSVS